MRVDHRRAHVIVTQQFLNCADVVPASIKCVAKLCRNAWLVARLLIPDRRTAAVTALEIGSQGTLPSLHAISPINQ